MTNINTEDIFHWMRDFNRADVSQWIKYYRIQAKYSQKDMSKKLGVTLVSYKKYERDINNMSILRLQSISSILDIPIDKFLRKYNQSKSKLKQRVRIYYRTNNITKEIK